MSDIKEVTPFPRGYATKEKTLRMLIDEDVPLEALKDFLIHAILAVEHQHKGIRVDDLNKVLIELTSYFVDNEVVQ